MPNPLDVLRSILFYIIYYGGTLLLVLVAKLLSLFGPRLVQPIARFWGGFHHFCVNWLLGIRIKQHGELPRESALVAIKHESFFDALELPYLFEGPAVFAKAELLRIPVWGKLCAANGLIPVERDQGAKALRAMLGAAKESAQSGRVLVIFPEGTRVPHGHSPKLQAGFAALYKALALPVVPVAVNSGPLYHRRWKKRGTITISVGETIPPGLPRGEVEARVHTAINRLNA